tara:strand:- start:3543 stop:3875 length:333 start_codon:yes stop_codon:yes gene_type:complete
MSRLRQDSKPGIEYRYGTLYEVPSSCYVEATFKLRSRGKKLYIAKAKGKDHFNFIKGDGTKFEPISACGLWLLEKLPEYGPKPCEIKINLNKHGVRPFIDWYKEIINKEV